MKDGIELIATADPTKWTRHHCVPPVDRRASLLAYAPGVRETRDVQNYQYMQWQNFTAMKSGGREDGNKGNKMGGEKKDNAKNFGGSLASGDAAGREMELKDMINWDRAKFMGNSSYSNPSLAVAEINKVAALIPASPHERLSNFVLSLNDVPHLDALLRDVGFGTSLASIALTLLKTVVLFTLFARFVFPSVMTAAMQTTLSAVEFVSGTFSLSISSSSSSGGGIGFSSFATSGGGTLGHVALLSAMFATMDLFIKILLKNVMYVFDDGSDVVVVSRSHRHMTSAHAKARAAAVRRRRRFAEARLRGWWGQTAAAIGTTAATTESFNDGFSGTSSPPPPMPPRPHTDCGSMDVRDYLDDSDGYDFVDNDENNFMLLGLGGAASSSSSASTNRFEQLLAEAEALLRFALLWTHRRIRGVLHVAADKQPTEDGKAKKGMEEVTPPASRSGPSSSAAARNNKKREKMRRVRQQAAEKRIAERARRYADCPFEITDEAMATDGALVVRENFGRHSAPLAVRSQYTHVKSLEAVFTSRFDNGRAPQFDHRDDENKTAGGSNKKKWRNKNLRANHRQSHQHATRFSRAVAACRQESLGYLFRNIISDIANSWAAPMIAYLLLASAMRALSAVLNNSGDNTTPFLFGGASLEAAAGEYASIPAEIPITDAFLLGGLGASWDSSSSSVGGFRGAHHSSASASAPSSSIFFLSSWLSEAALSRATGRLAVVALLLAVFRAIGLTTVNPIARIIDDLARRYYDNRHCRGIRLHNHPSHWRERKALGHLVKRTRRSKTQQALVLELAATRRQQAERQARRRGLAPAAENPPPAGIV